MNRQIAFLVIRWVIALGLFITAFLIAPKPTPDEAMEMQQGGAASSAITGMGLLIGAVALIAPELIALMSRFFQSVMSGIFYPNETGVAPANYTLTRFYRKEGRYEEAVEQCHSILGNHPQEMKAYAAGIENAILAEKPEEVTKFLSMARRRLKDREALEYVEAIHARASQMNLEQLAEENMEEDTPERPDGGYANGYGGQGGYGAS